MKIATVINKKKSNASIVYLDRAEFTSTQELAYKFAESILKNGTPLLRIEAQSRLAGNGLTFSAIYQKL